MDYLNLFMQKWMPSQQRVAVDSTPKLHGIWDTINSTLATPGPPTRLPPDFYGVKARSIIDRIVTEEEYTGFIESNEYRIVGIGALLGEVVERMVHNYPKGNEVRVYSQQQQGEAVDKADGLPISDISPKIALFGCHDSTLAATLASLGALEGGNHSWPSYTSSLAIELFQDIGQAAETARAHESEPHTEEGAQQYVRIRYNDSPVIVPGCRPPGRSLEGDESFCTLVSRDCIDRCFFETRLFPFQKTYS